MIYCRGMLVALAVLVLAGPAWAELQNVEVGGEVRIGGDLVPGWAVHPNSFEVRVPAFQVPKRPVGDMILPNPAGNGLGVISPYAWDKRTANLALVEQRTRLHVKADFTDQVNAFVELESYDFWGEDFRSNYITGADARAVTNDDLEVYQSYIEANGMYGTPLRLRVGRQELAFGSQWLVGPKDFGPFFRGRSFDAIRLTYATEQYSVDAWTSKLSEAGVTEQDGDVDFYGVWATCHALENITFDAYWLLVRDARSLNDTNYVWAAEWLEDWLGLDDYDPAVLNSVGLRASGKVDAFDFDAEGVYQFGSADQVGFRFKPMVYGDDGADFDAWAFNAGLGYTFDMTWNPRVHAAYYYYSGEDNRDISFLDWINPFYTPEASVSFNRLFSNVMHGGFLDLMNDFSNGQVITADVMVHPTESLMVQAVLTYFLANEPFAAPAYFTMGRYRVPLAPGFSFWDKEGSSDLGLQTDLVAVYQYSEDLSFLVHWSHMFVGDGLKDGTYSSWNGLMFNGGSADDDSDYFRFETRLAF